VDWVSCLGRSAHVIATQQSTKSYQSPKDCANEKAIPSTSSRQALRLPAVAPMPTHRPENLGKGLRAYRLASAGGRVDVGRATRPAHFSAHWSLLEWIVPEQQ